MERGDTSTFDTRKARYLRAPLPRSYTDFIGRKLLRFIITIQGLGAFALITLGVLIRKFNVARQIIRPMIRHEIGRAGLRLLPLFLFLSLALGLVVIGQTV